MKARRGSSNLLKSSPGKIHRLRVCLRSWSPTKSRRCYGDKKRCSESSHGERARSGNCAARFRAAALRLPFRPLGCLKPGRILQDSLSGTGHSFVPLGAAWLCSRQANRLLLADHQQARKRRPCGFDSHRPLHFSLPGVSLRCARTRLSLSPRSHSIDAATTVLLIDCLDRSVSRVRSPWSPPSSIDPEPSVVNARFTAS